jgi:hypothetical protein
MGVPATCGGTCDSPSTEQLAELLRAQPQRVEDALCFEPKASVPPALARTLPFRPQQASRMS